ncbi:MULTISPECIES: 2-hydroxychromene-2-carboxylate isomerase [Rhizobium]|jgi:2-hydroxychromene-2-carboxylate isomerase|uniref:2-hydroxychromene-2-carboxylate isomerase n=1 Tax=Rhizobium lusitanum TaxID=293958 RepID=A0A1C3WNI7_9HYPH|nr:DsbA family protein [Rhizobium lusitanum]SCB41587.1 2-hydroxychromene-2-carboxylate isomerase [Rhizobium lusitanum]
MTKTIDYFFGIGSPWSYIGLDPFIDLAARFGAKVHPYLIPLIVENGAIYSRERPDARRAYWVKDLQRWAAIRGKTLDFTNRSALTDPTPAGFLVLAAQLEGMDWVALTRALQQAFWSNGADIGNADVRKAIANGAGFDGAALEARAAFPDISEFWSNNREVAKEAGVFGLPTFRYEGELYWGQDSLPFLERHLSGEKLVA